MQMFDDENILEITKNGLLLYADIIEYKNNRTGFVS